MGLIEILALITAVVPILTPLIKKLLKTDKWESKDSKKATHAIIPLAVGVFAAVAACAAGVCDQAAASCSQGSTWLQCVLGGLAAGAGGAYVRDFDKNVTGLAQNGAKIAAVLLKKKDE